MFLRCLSNCYPWHTKSCIFIPSETHLTTLYLFLKFPKNLPILLQDCQKIRLWFYLSWAPICMKKMKKIHWILMKVCWYTNPSIWLAESKTTIKNAFKILSFGLKCFTILFQDISSATKLLGHFQHQNNLGIPGKAWLQPIKIGFPILPFWMTNYMQIITMIHQSFWVKSLLNESYNLNGL